MVAFVYLFVFFLFTKKTWGNFKGGHDRMKVVALC